MENEKKLEEILGIPKEEIEKMHVVKEDMDKIPEPERSFIYYRAAIIYINGINSIDRGVMEVTRAVRKLLPVESDELKIVLSRIDDIKMDEVDDLTSLFVDNLFTINGKKVDISLPEVGDFNDTEFKKELIKNIKLMDQQVMEFMECKEICTKKFNEDIPDNIKELAANIEKGDKFVIDYLREKSKRQDLTDEQKQDFEKKIQYKEYGRTLTPIIDSIEKQVAKRGSRDSIIYGFKTNNSRVLTAAVQVCHANKISFPFKMFIGLEEKMFGDKYKEYNNLFLYLLARYIKYKKDNVSEYDKVFLTDLHAVLATLNRPKAEEIYPDMYNTVKNSIHKILTLVTEIE